MRPERDYNLALAAFIKRPQAESAQIGAKQYEIYYAIRALSNSERDGAGTRRARPSTSSSLLKKSEIRLMSSFQRKLESSKRLICLKCRFWTPASPTGRRRGPQGKDVLIVDFAGVTKRFSTNC
jgi:hypothetical protein